MKRLAVGALLILWTADSAPAQSPLAFEVASVKPAAPPAGAGVLSHTSSDPGKIDYSSVSLNSIVAAAYEIKERRIVGPAWLRTQLFDIVAKLPAGATRKQVPQMLQTLLAERFALKTHQESKVMPVYALVTTKRGSKMKAAVTESSLAYSSGLKGGQVKGTATMAELADNLSGLLDRPVVDGTALKGAFKIELIWSSDDAPSDGETKGIFDAADGQSVFSAIQEKLGLKLETRKAPVGNLVIDHVEKPLTN